MVSILQRHGARHPTEDAGLDIEATLAKAKAAHDITDPSLQFVYNFTYSYIPEQLVWFGRKQSYVSGRIIAKKYAALGTSNFVRAASLDRIVESSRWWRQGFEGGRFDISISSLPEPDLVISGTNNTLDVRSCRAAEAIRPKPGYLKSQEWISKFASNITRALNSGLQGANLTEDDTANLMGLCGFDTAAKNGTASPWCNVFSKTDFENYEYSVDLSKYYSDSYGSVYGPSHGVGWVNELLARLTGTEVQDHTTTNATLDGNRTTFPLGPLAPKIFADFSTDNNIAMILSALGILRDEVPLPVTSPVPADRQFYASRLVPFAGSTVVEKLSCSETSARPGRDYVRILVNDAVVKLESSHCEPLGKKHGLCSLSGFLDSQKFARSGGDWASCFSDSIQAS
ncbi:histidine phosphatase family containing protein [Ceratobasidium sp. AG-Ba]|nr:histidine phosphatase family containing protein [Ceratobasidium sp. AG-Ba]